MLDDATMWRLIPLLPAVIGVLLSGLSFTVSVTSFGRQLPGAFQVVTGRIMIVFGCLAVIGGAVASFLPSPESFQVLLAAAFASSMTAGVALIVLGVRRVRTAPSDADLLAAGTLAAHVSRGLSPARTPAGSAVFNAALIRRLLTGGDPMTTLAGGPGSGKTVTLQEISIRISKVATAERRPSRIAIYVDLAGLSTLAAAPTSDQIREHIISAVAGNDQNLRTMLTDFLKGAASPGVQCVFLLDAFDEAASSWPRDQIEDLCATFAANLATALLPGKDRFRSIIACRDEIAPCLATPVVEMSPLTRRQQHQMLQQMGVATWENKRLLSDLRRVAPEVANAPLPLKLWCEDLATGSSAPPAAGLGLDEIVRTTVRNRLDSLPAGSASNPSTVRAVAEKIAALMVTDGAIGQPTGRATLEAALQQDQDLRGVNIDAAMLALVQLRLAAAHTYTFSFAHQAFLEHFAASWLIGQHASADLASLLDNPRWQRSLAAAFRAGPPTLRVAMVREVTVRADTFFGRIPARLSDVSRFLSTPPHREVPFVAPVEIAPILRSPLLPSLLTVARHADGAGSEVLRRTADRLLVLAFAGGSGSDQRRALGLMRMASPEVSLWSVQRAIQSDGPALYAAARAMTELRLVVPTLPWKARSRLILRLGHEPDLAREIARTATPTEPPDALPRLVASLIWMTRIMMALTILNTLRLVPADVLEPNWFGLVLDLLFVGAASAYLVRSYSVVDWGDQRWEWYLTAGLWGWWLFFGVVVVLSLPGTLIDSDSSLFSSIVLVYILSWPMAGLLCLALAGPLIGRERWYPQWQLGRLLLDRAVRNMTAVANRGARTNLKSLSGLLLSVLVLAYLVGIFAAPLPYVEKSDEQDIRTWIVGGSIGAFVLWMLVSSLMRRLVAYRRLRRRFDVGMITDSDLLTLLDRADGEVGLRPLFQAMRRSTRDGHVLRRCANVLIDLDGALDLVARLVPAETKTRIPPALWDLGGAERYPGFRDWLQKYDAKHPGRLSWLADKQRNTIQFILAGIAEDVS